MDKLAPRSQAALILCQTHPMRGAEDKPPPTVIRRRCRHLLNHRYQRRPVGLRQAYQRMCHVLDSPDRRIRIDHIVPAVLKERQAAQQALNERDVDGVWHRPETKETSYAK